MLDDVPNFHHLHKFGEGAIGWKDVFYLSPHGISRPVTQLSFIANWLTTGDDIWFLKFTNLMIHLLCGLLIYRLSYLLLKIDIINNDIGSRNIALWIAALWLLSPYLLSTVLYVIQRMAQLSALFTLCGLLSYVSGRLNYGDKNSSGIFLIITSFILFWPLATLCKQNGILLPLLILITEFFFFYKDNTLLNIKRLRRILICLLCIPGVMATGWFILNIETLVTAYDGRSFTLYERLITQPRVLLDYIGNLLLIPGASAMSLFHDDFVKSTSLFNSATTISALLICLLFLISAYFAIGRKTGIFFYGVIFFLAAHLVESSFIPLELYFEHRNYLPAFGVYFSCATLFAVFISKIKYGNLAIIILLIVPITFSIFTYQRAITWQKLTSIYFTAEITHPDSPRVNEGIAFLYLLINDSNNALQHLDKVIGLNPEQRRPEFYFKYLLAYCQGNKKMLDVDFAKKLNISSLSNDLTTIIYFQYFIDSVELGKCDSLDLNKIANVLIAAAANKNEKFDMDNTSHINILLARLLNYLGRTEESKTQTTLAILSGK